MPDKDKNFGGSLVLDFRKWWRHIQAKNYSIRSDEGLPIETSALESFYAGQFTNQFS